MIERLRFTPNIYRVYPTVSIPGDRLCGLFFKMHNEGFNFWSKAHLASLRRNMSTREAIKHFKQNNCENLYQAWGRFTNLVRSVHHHGFSLLQLFQFFYEGLDEDAQAWLFVLDGGTLMDKTVEEAWEYLDSILKELEQPIVEEVVEDDEDDGVVMSEDEEGTIHFHWKKGGFRRRNL